MAHIATVFGAAAALLALTACERPDAAPVGGGSTVDLTGYTMAFADEFDGPLDVTPYGCGSKWIAHTPWYGDFGTAPFADPELPERFQNDPALRAQLKALPENPEPRFPFTLEDGILSIEVRREEDGQWRTGLLSSRGLCNAGYAFYNGYVEMRAKLPHGRGAWAAFWLIGGQSTRLGDEADLTAFGAEIDIFEHYGHMPNRFSSHWHVWPNPVGEQVSMGEWHEAPAGSLTTAFNTWGAKLTDDEVILYFNREEFRRFARPAEFDQPFYVLVNMAMDGRETPLTPSPLFMEIDYIRVWEPNAAAP